MGKPALALYIYRFFPTPVHREGSLSQRLTARVKIASAPVFPTASFCRRGQFPICLCVCLSVCGARATSQIWEQKRCSLLLRTRQPKFLHRPKRLRCDSDPAGAATPQIAPPTRAPAGRRLTDARHSRHARSRSHLVATVRPPSLLKPESRSRRLALKLPCATTLSSLDAAVVTRRRRRVTSFAFPSGGAPTGASLHLDRLPLQRRRPRAPSMQTAPTAARASRLFAHVRRDVQLGIRRRLRRRWPRLGFRPARADSMWDRTIVSCHMCDVYKRRCACGNKSVHDRVYLRTALPKVRAIHNRKRDGPTRFVGL